MERGVEEEKDVEKEVPCGLGNVDVKTTEYKRREA